MKVKSKYCREGAEMSRSNYCEIEHEGTVNLYRASVERAIKGKRGQKFLRNLLAAMDALPVKELYQGDLVSIDYDEKTGQNYTLGYCALGTVCKDKMSIDDLLKIDSFDHQELSRLFNISPRMAAEIMFENDEGESWLAETPVQRFDRMRLWVAGNIV